MGKILTVTAQETERGIVFRVRPAGELMDSGENIIKVYNVEVDEKTILQHVKSSVRRAAEDYLR
jgi:hypothetical protein